MLLADFGCGAWKAPKRFTKKGLSSSGIPDHQKTLPFFFSTPLAQLLHAALHPVVLWSENEHIVPALNM